MSIKEPNMTTRYLMTVGAALVLGAAFIAGPASAAGTTGEKTPINDSWLTSKTKIALFADARVKGRQIDVERKGR
jgi:osmotically-inducible protein OsmY